MRTHIIRLQIYEKQWSVQCLDRYLGLWVFSHCRVLEFVQFSVLGLMVSQQRWHRVQPFPQACRNPVDSFTSVTPVYHLNKEEECQEWECSDCRLNLTFYVSLLKTLDLCLGGFSAGKHSHSGFSLSPCEPHFIASGRDL